MYILFTHVLHLFFIALKFQIRSPLKREKIAAGKGDFHEVEIGLGGVIKTPLHKGGL
jgi:hypothetical protein